MLATLLWIITPHLHPNVCVIREWQPEGERFATIEKIPLARANCTVAAEPSTILHALLGQTGKTKGKRLAGQRWGRYERFSVAGSGSFAVTYRAIDDNGDEVALKVLSRNWANQLDVLHRFQAECEILRTASQHLDPHDAKRILAYRDAGLEPEPWLATEFCSGGSLAGRIGPEWRRLPLAERIGMTAWVGQATATALAVAHDHLDIVHRDLSPSNLLLRTPEATELVLADFGLMKLAALQSNFSRVVGTERYASPEVRVTGTCDHRSDLYSLGVICLDLLRPELGSPSITDLPVDLPPELAGLISSLLAVDPDDRPSNALDAAKRFAPFATSPPPYVPPSAPDRPALSAQEPGGSRPSSQRRSLVTPRRLVPIAVAAVTVATIVGALSLGGEANERTSSTTVQTISQTTMAPTTRSSATGSSDPPETNEAPLLTQRLSDAGNGIALRLPADWVEEPLDANSPLVFAALSEASLMVLVVGTQPSDVNTAIQSTVLVGSEMAVASSDIDGAGWGRLELVSADDASGPSTEIYAFIPQSCGVYSLGFTKLGELTEGDRSLIESILGSVELRAPTILPVDSLDPPVGYESFERYRTADLEIFLPPNFALSDSSEKCLFAFESGAGDRTPASVNVTYFPSLSPEIAGDIATSAWLDSGYELIEQGTAANIVTGEDVERRLLRSVDGGDLVVWLYQRGGGIYSVEVVEGPRQESGPGRTALFDQIAAGVRFASDQ